MTTISPRQWTPGEGWTPSPPTTCKTCAAPIPPREGKGRPFAYCAAHAPSSRARVARWYARNRDHVREYQQQREGRRVIGDRVCPTPDCGRTWRGYGDLCSRCRQRERRGRL